MPGAIRPRYLRDIESQEAGRDLGWHTHDFGQFFSAIRGSMYVGTRDRVLLLNPAMAVWIPPDVEHWLRYVSSNKIIYVDVNRAEAERLGTEPRIVHMTPLLQALMGVVPDSQSSGLAKPHEAALYELLFHEIVTARDIPLSVARWRFGQPQDDRAAFHNRNRNAAFALVAANPHSSRRLPACRRQENQLGGARSGLPVAKRLHLHVSQRHRVEPARLPPNREKRRQIGCARDCHFQALVKS